MARESMSARVRIRLAVCLVFALQGWASAAEVKVLFDFEDAKQLKAWGSEQKVPVSLHVGPDRKLGRASLHVRLPAGPWPGVVASVPRQDWSSYTALRFRVWAERNVTINVRIDDVNSRDHATRFSKRMGVTRAGENRVQVDLREVAKRIDLGKVVRLVIFCTNLKQPADLWIDQIELADYEPEWDNLLIPGELGPKKDITYSLQVETPHIEWGKPAAFGRLRVLMVPSVTYGREVVEFMQRFDWQVETVTIDPAWDRNRWGFGDFYGIRGDKGDFRLVLRYLENALNDERGYDVIVLPALHGWDNYPRRVRQRILELVSSGTGLVYVHPYCMKADSAAAKTLKELSPLLGGEGDYFNPGGYLATKKGATQTGRWKKVADHPVVRAIPVDALPTEKFRFYRYAVRDGAQLVLAAGDMPILAVGTYGKGRVVACTWRGADITPRWEANPREAGPSWRWWEYAYSLMGKAVRWAAGRQPQVEVVEVQVSPRAPNGLDYAVSLRAVDRPRKARLEIVWRNGSGRIEGRTEVVRQVGPGTTAVTGRFVKSDGLLLDGMQFVDVIVRDASSDAVYDWGSGSCRFDGLGRVLVKSVGSLNVPSGQALPVTVEVRLKEPGETGWRLRAELIDHLDRVVGVSERLVPESGEYTLKIPVDNLVGDSWGRAVCTLLRDGSPVARAVSEDVGLVADPEQKSAYEVYLLYRLAAKKHLRPFYYKLIDSLGMISEDERVVCRVSPPGLGVYAYERASYDAQKAAYYRTKDKKYLVRKPCLSDPAYWQSVAARIKSRVESAKPWHPRYYFLKDELSFTSYRDAFDLCWSPHCLKNFRRWLRDKYGSLEELNAAWGTDFTRWEDVVPYTADEARAAGNFAPWADHRSFNEYLFARTICRLRQMIRQYVPDAKVYISGTQATSAHNGCDWWQIDKCIDAMESYSGGDQWELHRCFGKRVRLGISTGFGSKGAPMEHNIWRSIFHNFRIAYIFWQFSTINPDMTLSSGGRTMKAVFGEVRRLGIVRLLRSARQDNSRIAVHWSVPSIHIAWILNRLERHDADRHGWLVALEDAGFQYDMLARQDLEAGALTRKKFDVLVLPDSIAMSDAELHAVRQFLEAGGVVLTDGTPGIYNENGRPRPGGLLGRKLQPGSVVKVGNGRLVVLAEDLAGYTKVRTQPDGAALRTRIDRALREAGLSPVFEMSAGDASALARVERFHYAGDGFDIYAALQEPFGGKTVVGADGVAQYVGESGQPIEHRVIVKLPRKGHIYRLGAGRYFGYRDTVECRLVPGKPLILLSLPEKITALEVDVPESVKVGGKLGVAGRIVTESGNPVSLPVRIELTGPDGSRPYWYGRTVLTVGGRINATIGLAFNDKPGKWTVCVQELSTGVSVEKQVLVTQR